MTRGYLRGGVGRARGERLDRRLHELAGAAAGAQRHLRDRLVHLYLRVERRHLRPGADPHRGDDLGRRGDLAFGARSRLWAKVPSMSVLGTLPIFLVAPTMQRYLVHGIALGGAKG